MILYMYRHLDISVQYHFINDLSGEIVICATRELSYCLSHRKIV